MWRKEPDKPRAAGEQRRVRTEEEGLPRPGPVLGAGALKVDSWG